MIKQIIAAVSSRDAGDKAILLVTISNVVSNVLTIISGLLVARWMLPAELGVFNSFSILTSYIILVQMGIPSGLSRQFPFYMGMNSEDKATDMASVSATWSISLGTITLLIAGGVGVWLFWAGQYEYAAGACVVGITSFEGFFVTKHLKILYRSNNDFAKLSRITLAIGFVSFASIVLVSLYGFYGLCLRTLIVFIFNLILTLVWLPVRLQFSWNRETFKELFRVGMPIYTVANIYSLWPVIQRTWVLYSGGAQALGLFGLALIVESSLGVLTTSISGVVFPKMSLAWGQGCSVRDLLKIVVRPAIAGFLICLFVAVVGWWLLPYFVELLLPNYQDGLDAARVSLLVGSVAVLSVFSNVYMIVQRNRHRLISYVTGFVVWAISLVILLETRGFELIHFPLAMLVAYAGIYAVDFYFLRRYDREFTADVVRTK